MAKGIYYQGCASKEIHITGVIPYGQNIFLKFLIGKILFCNYLQAHQQNIYMA